MKNNQVSIFVFLILSAVIGGVLFFVNRSSQEYLGWSPDEMYGDLSRAAYDGSAFTNATFSGSSNGGGVALSMQGGSLSSRMRVSSSRPITSHQYPISNSPLSISNLQSPIANGPSPIAYMTSGAEYRSFGGGGNGNMGTAGTFRTNTQSPITNSQLPISNIQLPIANTQSPISNIQLPITNNPSPIANSQLPIANTPSSMFGYELQTTYGVASYEDMDYSGFSGRSSIRGRQKLSNNGPSVGDTWLIWLSQHTGYGSSGDGGWYFNTSQLHDAWEAYCAAWNETMGKCPTWEEWLAWFMGDGGSHTWGSGDNVFNAYFVPVGDMLPLLLIALLYMIILFVKRNKIAQL